MNWQTFLKHFLYLEGAEMVQYGGLFASHQCNLGFDSSWLP